MNKILVCIFLLMPCSLTFAMPPQLLTQGTFGLYDHDMATELVVTNPNGKRTGFDPITNQTFKEDYPNSSYFIDNQTGLPQDNVNEFSCDIAIDGLYTIKVIGKALSKYYIAVDYPRPLPLQDISINGFADVNKVDIYTLNYNFAAGQSGTPLIPVKVAVPADLIADVNAAGKLGYVGHQEFVNELIKKVQKIEKERTEVQKPEEQTLRQAQGDKEREHLTPAQKAIKEYKELLKELTEKYQRPEGDEFVKQEAYTVLKEDLGYIIGHIQ